MADRKTTLTIDLKPTGQSAVASAFADVAKSIEGQQSRLDRLRASMSPENLRARAIVELDTEEAEKKLKELLAAEKRKIPIDVLPADATKSKGMLGHASDWLKRLGLPGGDMLGKIGEHLGAHGDKGDSIGGMFKAFQAGGGVGGLLKSLLGGAGAPPKNALPIVPTTPPNVPPAKPTPSTPPNVSPAKPTPSTLPNVSALASVPAPTKPAAAPPATGGGALKGLLGGGGSAASGGAAASGAAGAGAGMLAAAGPIGLAIGAAAMLTPVVKKLASAPFDAIAGGMGAVNKALGGLTGSLGAIGSVLGGIGSVGSSMKSVGDSLGPLGIGLSVMGGAIEGITSQVTAFLNTALQLAGKALPGVTKRFQMAADDTAAVVGHRLVPVVELMTTVMRGIGDVLQTVLPSSAEFRSALAPLGEAFDEVKAAVTPFLPMIKSYIVGGLRLIGAQIKQFATGLKVLIGPLLRVNEILNRMGMGFNAKGLDSSVGAAARPVSFMDSQSYARSVYTAAGGSGVDPAKATAKNTGTMANLLQQIRDKLPGGGLSVPPPGPKTANFLNAMTFGSVNRFLWGH